MNESTIEIKIEDALALVQNLLPVLEAVPAIAPEAGLASLAVTGAQVVTPLVFKLYNNLAAQGAISVEDQQATLDRWNKLLDFSGGQWQPSTAGPDPIPPEKP